MADLRHIKKGDFVALETTHTVYYAATSGARVTSEVRWQIVKVTTATRKGEVKAVQLPGENSGRTLVHLAPYKPRWWTMENHQIGAAMVFADWHNYFASADETRAAVLKAEGIEIAPLAANRVGE